MSESPDLGFFLRSVTLAVHELGSEPFFGSIEGRSHPCFWQRSVSNESGVLYPTAVWGVPSFQSARYSETGSKVAVCKMRACPAAGAVNIESGERQTHEREAVAAASLPERAAPVSACWSLRFRILQCWVSSSAEV